MPCCSGVFETGLRIGEALGIHVEDLDLTRGDEHLTVIGKGNRSGRSCWTIPGW
ncbi:hypothetical protein [Deinococcus wulumuqiensis]|uniref:hypothetical protein n=1 Tax=Deinococcus wulumuqiensis TaxID=980427 RepID=UPI0035EE40DD